MVLERHRVSYCRFCENSASKFLSGNNDGHLWAEFTHNIEVSEKASLQVSLRIVPYSACDSTISKTSHLRFLNMSARKLHRERVIEHCEMNSHITKQILRKLGSAFSWRIIIFSFYSSKLSEISLLRIHGNSPKKRLQKSLA